MGFKLAMLCSVAVACSFSGTDPVGGGDSDAAPGDDATTSVDADLSPDADPGCQMWQPPALHFDNCALGAPQPMPDLTGASPYVYSTTTGMLTDDDGVQVALPFVSVAQATQSNIAVLYVDSFDLPLGQDLFVTGDLPLVIASESTLIIAGRLSAASFINPLNGRILGSAAATVDHCIAAGNGVMGMDGGGGGGGGYGAIGGNGAGGDGDASGGAGGGAVDLATEIAAGCPGGSGRDENGVLEADGGEGGMGGGAVQLTARTSILITGTIHTGGMAGENGDQDRNGGGGGGSGGFIGLDSPRVDIEITAFMLAHGGGAGEGSGNSNPGQRGANADATFSQAQGGSNFSGNGGDGGNGGFDNDIGANGNAGTSDGGGGGGGGGVGHIKYRSANWSDLGQAIPTPAMFPQVGQL